MTTLREAAEAATPRTEDALIDNADFSDWGSGKSTYVHADFARELERENAELREELRIFRLMTTDASVVRANLLRGTIARPDDLLFKNDTNGEFELLRQRCERAEGENAEVRMLLTRAIGALKVLDSALNLGPLIVRSTALTKEPK